MEKIRLDKFIANQLNITRSQARINVRRGQALVNGICIKDPATIIDADIDLVQCGGSTVAFKKNVYILMNKPAGVLSASNDKSKKTVVDLVPENMQRRGLFPVGRLDKDTTGMLIITDDGEFAHNCISPSKKVPKCYEVVLDGEVSQDMITRFKQGVRLADGTVCKSAILEHTGKCTARITIGEGKYHQIKRMFGTVGLGVNALHRISIGALNLPDNLKTGECVELDEKQVKNALEMGI